MCGSRTATDQWADRQDRAVVVEPPPGAQEIHKLQLVDVHNPDRGIARPVGSDGSQDPSSTPSRSTPYRRSPA